MVQPATPGPSTLRVLDQRSAICRLPADAAIPEWATGELVSVVRTPASLTVVCAQDRVPAGVETQRDWRVLQVTGELPFDAVGILAALATPLARAGIPIFAVCSFETDFVLVHASRLAAAVAALRSHGHRVG